MSTCVVTVKAGRQSSQSHGFFLHPIISMDFTLFCYSTLEQQNRITVKAGRQSSQSHSFFLHPIIPMDFALFCYSTLEQQNRIIFRGPMQLH
jgi:hypothetical protein